MAVSTDPDELVSQFFTEVGGLSGFLVAVTMAVVTGYVVSRFMRR